MKKFLITLIVLLLILAVAQGIFYKIRPKVNIPKDEQDGVETLEKALYIYGMLEVYENYKPSLSLEELQKQMYEFVYVDLPEIYKNIEGKPTEELKKYYNKNDINTNMHIHSEEDFIMIAKQLQNIYYTKKDIILIESRIDTENIKYANGLISFDVILEFDNDRELKIKVILSEIDKMFQILSYSDLDRIFSKYDLNMKKYDFLDKIDSFISSVSTIRVLSTLKTENEKSLQFEEKKDYMENLLITSSEDYISITNQINNMYWIKGDLIFENYEINYESIEQTENYDNFKMTLYYNYDSKIDLIISIKNNQDVIPEIKISGDESDFLNVKSN